MAEGESARGAIHAAPCRPPRCSRTRTGGWHPTSTPRRRGPGEEETVADGRFAYECSAGSLCEPPRKPRGASFGFPCGRSRRYASPVECRHECRHGELKLALRVEVLVP